LFCNKIRQIESEIIPKMYDEIELATNSKNTGKSPTEIV